jgi:hypothetical protein
LSADNGIYILQTYGPEFRVVHAQAIDNIYGTFADENMRYLPDPNMIVEYFGRGKKFDNIEEAWDFALDLEYKTGYTEYGCCLISEFSEYMFSDFEGQNAQAIVRS